MTKITTTQADNGHIAEYDRLKLTHDDCPKLYVGTYAKYNNGSIAGGWLDLAKFDDAEQAYKAMHAMHKDEDDAELMVQDFENLPRDLYSESMGLTEVEDIYNWLELADYEREIVAEFAETFGEQIRNVDVDTATSALVLSPSDIGPFQSTKTALADYYIEAGCMEIPDNMTAYFDYEAYGRDLMHDHSESKNGFVFSSNY